MPFPWNSHRNSINIPWKYLEKFDLKLCDIIKKISIYGIFINIPWNFRSYRHSINVPWNFLSTFNLKLYDIVYQIFM